MNSRQPLGLLICTTLHRALIALYPPSTRRTFGAELRAVTAEMLADARARGGTAGMLRLWPRLMLDGVIALLLEHFDLWWRARVSPSAVAACCLSCAASVWALILLASNANADWAARLLDTSVPLSMTLALGLPLAALGSSRVALRGRPSHTSTAIHWPRFWWQISTVSTLAAWATFACHVAA